MLTDTDRQRIKAEEQVRQEAATRYRWRTCGRYAFWGCLVPNLLVAAGIIAYAVIEFSRTR